MAKPGDPGRRFAGAFAQGRVLGLDPRHRLAVERMVDCGQAVVGRALEHVQVSRLACDLRIAWMPDLVVPMTPTRRPLKSTPSWGQRPVWYSLPLKLSRPGNSGMRGSDRQPTAMMQ